jgi:hypothetical protein
MTPQIQKPYQQLPAILFLFLQMLSLGTYTIFFLITFLTFDPQLFLERSEIFYQTVSGILLIGIISMILLVILEIIIKNNQNRELSFQLPQGKEEIRWFMIFMGVLTIVLIAKLFEIDLHLVSFLVFLGAVLYLFHLAQVYTFSFERPSWQNPTTAGAIIEGSIILGLSLALRFFEDTNLQEMLLPILLIMLLLELLTLWARFRFLSKSNAMTQRTVRMLLGTHLALFGVRFIFGLIMPVVYLCWILFVSSNIPFHHIILMVGVGELSERALFFITCEAIPGSESVNTH